MKPRNLQTLILLLLSASVLFISACNKLKKPSCEEDIGPLSDDWGFPLYEHTGPSNKWPEFNPSNPNEFVFIHIRSEDLPLLNLVKYNLATKEHSVLLKKYMGKPRWSKKGWILFNSYNTQLQRQEYWKIKDTGDSLTFLMSLEYGGNPDWNKKGDKFICNALIADNSPSGYTAGYLIVDENGLMLDTVFSILTSDLTWQQDSLVAFLNGSGLHVGNAYKGDFENVYLLDENQNELRYAYRPWGVEWIDDHRVIWTYRDGVLITDVNSGQTSFLRETCVSNRYAAPSFAPQTERLVFDHITLIRAKEGDGGIGISSMRFMYLDGSCEEEFNFSLE